jgi:hypothetical protein
MIGGSESGGGTLRACAPCWIALGLVVSAGSAAAQETPRVRFSFARLGDAGECTGESVLRARVSERLGYDPFVEPASQHIEGVVQRAEVGWSAHIYHRDLEGRALGERELTTGLASCTDLDEAIVLAVALVIDPERALAPPEPPVPPDRPAEPSPPSSPETPSSPEAPVGPRHEAAEPLTAPSPFRLEGSLAIHGGAAIGLVPGLGGTVDLEGAIRWTELPLFLLLGVVFVPESRTTDDSFGFGITAGIAGASWVWDFGIASVVPSLKVVLGALHAVVYERVPVEPGDQLWAAVAADVALRISLIHWLFLELSVSATVPITQLSFEIEGRAEPVFEGSAVIGSARAGIGVNFW